MKKLLVVGIVVLFIGVTVSSSTGFNGVEQSYIPTVNGKTLYVGGDGPGNYSKIQDAIDNASDGDTVFVYNDSSPYYENVVVDKSINLTGENRDTTVIDGSGNGDVVSVSAVRVNISGFAIRNSGSTTNDAGIEIHANFSTISDNNILNNYDGILFQSSSANAVTNNTISSNYRIGISLRKTNNNTIRGNTIISNNHCGIQLYPSSNNNIILENNISNNMYGITLGDYSNSNTISGNTITFNTGSDTSSGISLHYSKSNVITDNTISDNDWGIGLSDSSSGNTVSDNSLFNNGLEARDSYENTVCNNTVNGKPLVYLENETDMVIDDAGQVILINCGNITIQNQELSNASIGIELWDTNNCLILGNNISNNFYGIYFRKSSAITIMSNTITSNIWYGIYLYYSSSNTITSNTISNNLYGIWLYSSSNNNIISGNTIISNHGNGITLWGFPSPTMNNIISGNTISNHYSGILFQSSTIANTIMNNTISSNNKIGIQLGGSSNIITGNTIISNNWAGIYLGGSSNSITGNNISDNEYGIWLKEAGNNTLKGNSISNNIGGIYFRGFSNYNTIEGNNITSNNKYGIYVCCLSGNNTFTSNNIASNKEYGMYITGSYSNDNFIYHNNFVNNTQNAYDGCINTWDDGYPSGGNYWDDYTGDDNDSDGIGDTPYKISGGSNQDRYPLMEPWGNQPPNIPTIIGPIHGKVGVEYQYNFSLSEPNCDSMYLRVDWGNGTPGPWTGPFDSDTTVRLNHTWHQKGTFTIRAQAKDIYGAESNWSTLEVTMPKNKPAIQNIKFLQLSERFMNSFPLLEQLSNLQQMVKTTRTTNR